MELFPKVIFDGLYRAFSDEPRPRTVDACPCCMDAGQIRTLLTVPLHQITPRQLGGYAASVFLTVGSKTDFRYFLPRILEVLVTENGWWPAPEVVGKAMTHIPWEEYTEGQCHALNNYFDAIFDALLNAENPEGYKIDSWLCCASYTLSQWEKLLVIIPSEQGRV